MPVFIAEAVVAFVLAVLAPIFKIGASCSCQKLRAEREGRSGSRGGQGAMRRSEEGSHALPQCGTFSLGGRAVMRGCCIDVAVSALPAVARDHAWSSSCRNLRPRVSRLSPAFPLSLSLSLPTRRYHRHPLVSHIHTHNGQSTKDQAEPCRGSGQQQGHRRCSPRRCWKIQQEGRQEKGGCKAYCRGTRCSCCCRQRQVGQEVHGRPGVRSRSREGGFFLVRGQLRRR